MPLAFASNGFLLEVLGLGFKSLGCLEFRLSGGPTNVLGTSRALGFNHVQIIAGLLLAFKSLQACCLLVSGANGEARLVNLSSE